MLGFSFAELIIILLVTVILVKPKDLPEIAHFLGKIFYRLKHLYNSFKKSLKEIEKDLEIKELKQELQRGVVEEKIKLEEDETTVIVDLYGNEHRITNVPEDKREEIAKLNKKNQELLSSKTPNQDSLNSNK